MFSVIRWVSLVLAWVSIVLNIGMIVYNRIEYKRLVAARKFYEKLMKENSNDN